MSIKKRVHRLVGRRIFELATIAFVLPLPFMWLITIGFIIRNGFGYVIKAMPFMVTLVITTAVFALENYRNELLQLVEFKKAKHFTQREAEERLMIIEGWVPETKTADMDRYLQKSDVVYISTQAQPGEKVPVLLKNKKFARNFEFLGALYSLPKYGEIDLTPFFAPFYALFFGFCLGDTGYGILLTLAAIIAPCSVKA